MWAPVILLQIVMVSPGIRVVKNHESSPEPVSPSFKITSQKFNLGLVCNETVNLGDVGDVGPDVMVYLTCAVIGLGGRGVIKTWTEVAARVRLYMLTSDLTSLVPPQFSHWLQVRKVGTVIIIYLFII